MPRDISPDEGYRPHETLSSEPFFTEGLPCESCGKACNVTKPAEWDPRLLVGPCCSQSDSAPDVPVCPELLAVIDQCSLTSSVAAAMEQHRLCCGTCQAAAGLIRIAPQPEASIVRAMAERAQDDRQMIETLQEAGCTEAEIRAWMRQEAA